MRRHRVALGAALLPVAALAGAAALGLRIARVSGDEMAPSLRDGDWLLLGPGHPERGDVVLLPDPLDPGRRVLRRVLALPGERIAFTGWQPRVDGAALKQVAMGDAAGELVLMEAGAWLLAVSLEPTRFHAEETQVPDGGLYLAADHRSLALDSRWWGPVRESEVEARAWLRMGPPDTWRARVSRPRQSVRPEIPLLPYQAPAATPVDPAPTPARSSAG